ncbi:putative UDP-rhamnose:rhamnosyltransferase 1 [Malania oleifera]|uniref:putative UDP-rhamnose:rhamnosyltransferase 1 n=1 Tax=Malania oleifera TaxID=397392 RepID=UPI0025ADEFE7|nr:putative UDP-rhamnose:rhamnosyltransferase 1 [Malania oleifera]
MADKQYHVMMFPWLAFGHMLPFLELAKKLAAKGISISFISTPRNIQRLPSIPASLTDQIKLVEIPLPPTDGLPENSEATIDLQLEQVQYLKKAYDGLQAPFEMLLQRDQPDLILFDFIPCWVPETAARFGVPTAFFSVFSAATLAYTGPPDELKSFGSRTRIEDFTVAPRWIPFPSLVAHRPDCAARIFQNLKLSDISGMSSGQRLATTLEGCNFVVVRSCRDFEGNYLNLLEELYQKPVLPIGLLPPNLEKNKAQSLLNKNWDFTFKWLDKQKLNSVVFVGFGSEYKMPVEQIQELALGIELSKLPFIWILRKPDEVDSSGFLPSGFSARTSGQGIVCYGWAPQQEILAHPAIGGCLFHSGWGSIIESLCFGHPLILMPMMADQGLNAKLLVENGIGLEVQRNEDGSFDRDEVAKSMRIVMVEQEWASLRLKAAQVQTIFTDQYHHENYINKFVQHLAITRETCQMSEDPN